MKKMLLYATIFVLFLINQAMGGVPIIIEENGGIGRVNEPVSLGVPFSKGNMPATSPVRITDSNNIPINAQFIPMSLWDDGSIRWLKCDFQGSVAANSLTLYTLKTDDTHTQETELKVTESDEEITVTTGPLRFVVSKTHFNLFDRAWLDLNGDRTYSDDEEIISSGANSAGPTVLCGGTHYFASAHSVENIEIEEKGPMKVVIKISGRHYHDSEYFLKYETRMYAYAGQPFVKVWHVYANGKTSDSIIDSAEFDAGFDLYAINLKLNLNGSKTVRFGGENGDDVLIPLRENGNAQILQEDRQNINAQPFSYTITENDTLVSSGGKAEGWGDITDANWGVLVSQRYFWQKYPKGLAFDDEGNVSVQLAPTPEYLRISMGTGDEILFYFHSASEAADAKAMSMGLSKNPLVARTTPSHYAKSKAFYSLLGSPSSYPAMEDYIEEVTENHFSNRDALELYGNLNFGDVPRNKWATQESMDESSWGNNYYDGLLTMTRLFAQTGDIRYADLFVPAAWFFMETACWNTYDSLNSPYHGYCPSYSSHHRKNANYGHYYGEGLWYYYYLTGDERAREIGLRAASSIVNMHDWGKSHLSGRTAYQLASACLEAWKNTGDTGYFDTAKLIVNTYLETQDKYGLIGNVTDSGTSGDQTFMMGLFSDTLWKFIRELSPSHEDRQQLIDRLVSISDFFNIYARKNTGEEDYYNCWLPPNNNEPPEPRDPENIDCSVYWWGKGLLAGTYSYTYDVTGDESYKTLASNLLTAIWDSVNSSENEFWGKASCQVMKNMIHAVAIIDVQELPTVTILSPTTSDNYKTNSKNLDIQGTAADNKEISYITWSNDRGGSGIADGKDIWDVRDITLQNGINVITITAYDNESNTGSDILTVTCNTTEPDATPGATPTGTPAETLPATPNSTPDPIFSPTPEPQPAPSPYEESAAAQWVEGTQALDDGATRDYYHRAKLLKWAHYMGDWQDVNGISQGNTPYAKITLTDNNTARYVEWDVTSLVQKWIDGTLSNKGMFLHAISGNGTFNFYSREYSDQGKRPELVITTAGEAITITPEADVYLDPSTYQGMGDSTKLKLSENCNALIRFDVSDFPAGSRITNAVLRLFVYEDYGYSSLDVGVFSCNLGTTDSIPSATPTGIPEETLPATPVSTPSPVFSPTPEPQPTPSPYEEFTSAQWVEGTQALDDGATRDYYHRAESLKWAHYMGDWQDVNGISQGNTPYAKITLTDNNTARYVEWDVTSLVQKWIDGTLSNKGMFLHAISGNGTFNFYSREYSDQGKRPELVITTAGEAITITPEADVYLDPSTYQGMGDSTKLKLSENCNALIRFDVSDFPAGSMITNAVLRLFVYEDYGYSSLDIGIFSCDPGI